MLDKLQRRVQFGVSVTRNAWAFVRHASEHQAGVVLLFLLAGFSFSGWIAHLLHQGAYRPSPGLLWAAFGVLVFLALFEGAYRTWVGEQNRAEAPPELQALIDVQHRHATTFEGSYIKTGDRVELNWKSTGRPPEGQLPGIATPPLPPPSPPEPESPGGPG